MSRLTTCILVAAAGCVAVASDIPPPRPVDVAALVHKLGSEDFAEREEATRRLSTLSVDEPPPELLSATRSPELEVRDRARVAVRTLREQISLRREWAASAHLPRGERFAKRGQIDLYIASTATSKWKVDDDRLWVPAFDVGTAAVKKAGLKGEYKPRGPMWEGVKDFPTYRKVVHNNLMRSDGVFARRDNYFMFQGAVLAAGVVEPKSFAALVVSRGPVSAKGRIDDSLVLATGDVKAGEEIYKTVIICDGDVIVGERMKGCFVIARGSITVEGSGYQNTLIAGGTITFKKPVRFPNNQTLDKDMENVVSESVVKPLGYITFFELSTVGVEAKVADKAVQITAVADDKPFAASGVKVGDIVTEVNGKKPDSPESLRRLLRDALAVGDATVKLQRGGKIETVKVSLPE